MDAKSSFPRPLRVREFDRDELRCRARIRIGDRAYFGLIANISPGGARIVTETPIRDCGPVRIQLPDLSPILGEIRWVDGCRAGVQFCLKLDPETLKQWQQARMPRAA